MNDKPVPLRFWGLRKIYSGFGMKSALTERAWEPWAKGVHPKEAGVGKRAKQPHLLDLVNVSRRE